MTKIQFPLNTSNVAQIVAERDAEIERLRAALKRIVAAHPGPAVLSDPAGVMFEIAVNALNEQLTNNA